MARRITLPTAEVSLEAAPCVELRIKDESDKKIAIRLLLSVTETRLLLAQLRQALRVLREK
jgi:hypothetical protein